jgi:hypothetical protein
MGFAKDGGQRSGGAGGGGLMHAVTQVRSADGGEGERQPHVVQKLQSICVQLSVVSSCCRQLETHDGFVEQIPDRKLVNGRAAQSVWTRASSVSQVVAATLSSQPRNWPPPQTQAILESHTLGHQQASVRIVHRSLAA